MTPRMDWRPATPGDIPDINRIEAQVHTFAPERPEVWLDRMRVFGEGVLMLADGAESFGYGACYPWLAGEVPALDTLLEELPAAPDCLFIHDVALLPGARGRGFGGAFVAHATRLAQARGLSQLALVSVYGTTDVWGRCGFALADARSEQKMAIYGDTARYMVATLAAPRGSSVDPRRPRP